LKNKLSENTTQRIKETIEMHRLSRKLLEEWKIHFIEICKVCIANREDNMHNGSIWKCECDVQFYLDIIADLLNGGIND